MPRRCLLAHAGAVTISQPPILAARELVKAYGSTRALDGASITIAPGEHVALMGPSGSGKTTLLHALAGIIAPDAGQVLLDDEAVQSWGEGRRSELRRTRYGFVFQSGQLLAELPAEENVALPLLLAGVPRRAAVERARTWLRPLGLEGLGGRRPGELSGGQAQRVAIARALVGSPSVVFADEPTGALDSSTGTEVMSVLTGATRAAGAALVLVTHDPDVAAWCSRTAHVRDGRVHQDARVEAGL